MKPQRYLPLAAAALAAALAAANAGPPASPATAAAVAAGPPGTHDGPPKIEMLRDAAICPADGAYYLTGTAGSFDKSGRADFAYNRGAPLWKSADLKTWECLGYVFDRGKLLDKGRPKIGFWLDWNAPSERIDALLAQATTTPRLYRLGADWFLLCAMNDQAILLEKSTTGKPDGPYDDYTVLATRGGHPSIFTDDDGAHYLVFADAWIAKISPDLKELAEEIRPLLPAPGPNVADNRLKLGDRGTCLFKNAGRYFVFAPRWRTRGDQPSFDAVLWTADTVYGPYRETKTALAGAGSVTVFKTAEGAWKAVAGLPGNAAPRLLDVPL